MKENVYPVYVTVTCELQQLCAELGVDVEDKLDGEKPASVHGYIYCSFGA